MQEQGYFNSRFKFDKRRTTVWKSITKYLQRYVKKDSKILDLGAGYCDFINNIKAGEKYAVDSENIKKYANRNIKVFIQKCSDLKRFRKNLFDVIFASNLLEHLKRDELDKTIKEIRRVLKHDGKIIIVQPNFRYAYKNYFDDYTHELIFTHSSMSDFLKSHKFGIVKVIPKFLPFSMKSKLSVNSLLIKLYLLSPFKPFGGQFLIIAER